jgi:hypothetical protein
MTLKERLDAVWNTNEIAYPTHLCKWNEKNVGSCRFSDFGLWVQKGRNSTVKIKNIKYSLNRNRLNAHK